MIPKKLAFFVVLAIISSIVAGKKMHKCPSCSTGGFAMKRWLMQMSEAGQSMGWFDWRGTNCEDGTYFVIPCYASCVQIIIEKQRTTNEYEYAGTMQECSDQLIHASPDLPKDIDFKAFYGNAVYISKRFGHRITYMFRRDSDIDIEEYIAEHGDAAKEIPEEGSEDSGGGSSFTMIDGAMLIGGILAIIIILFFWGVKLFEKCRSKKIVTPSGKVDNIEEGLKICYNDNSTPEEENAENFKINEEIEKKDIEKEYIMDNVSENSPSMDIEIEDSEKTTVPTSQDGITKAAEINQETDEETEKTESVKKNNPGVEASLKKLEKHSDLAEEEETAKPINVKQEMEKEPDEMKEAVTDVENKVEANEEVDA